MEIRVRAFPILKEEVILNVNIGTTLRDLLNMVAERYGEDLKTSFSRALAR